MKVITVPKVTTSNKAVIVKICLLVFQIAQQTQSCKVDRREVTFGENGSHGVQIRSTPSRCTPSDKFLAEKLFVKSIV